MVGSSWSLSWCHQRHPTERGAPGVLAFSGSSSWDGCGGDGRLIVKARSTSYATSMSYLSNFDECDVDADVPAEVDLHYDSSGLHIRNFGINAQQVLLNMRE